MKRCPSSLLLYNPLATPHKRPNQEYGPTSDVRGANIIGIGKPTAHTLDLAPVVANMSSYRTVQPLSSHGATGSASSSTRDLLTRASLPSLDRSKEAINRKVTPLYTPSSTKHPSPLAVNRFFALITFVIYLEGSSLPPPKACAGLHLHSDALRHCNCTP